MTEIIYRSDIQVELIDSMGSDARIVQAARASTGNDEIPLSKKRGLIRYLASERHTSPFEHCVITVRVEAPISVVRQWERHRTQSYSELSLRFSEAAPQFYIPPVERPLANAGSGAHPDLVQHSDQVPLHADMSARRKRVRETEWEQYRWEVEAGIAEEVARDNLPLSTYSTFYATANLNNWLKFLDLRDGIKGAPQWEIVQGAQQMSEILAGLFPIAVETWQETR